MRAQSTWIAVAWLSILLVAGVLAWRVFGLDEWNDPRRIADAVEPYRTSWLALPVTIVIFVLAELLLFPVLVLIFACGLAFGPWLGPPYAMCGTLASAVVPFLIGRQIGRQRLERVGGALVLKLERVLERRGMIAVFLVRKIPAPFTLVNLVCGASPVSLRDFVIGTTFGMGVGVIAITVFGSQFVELWKSPGPKAFAITLAVFVLPLVAVLYAQRLLNRRLEGRA